MNPLSKIRQALEGQLPEVSWRETNGENEAILPSLGPSSFDSEQVTKLFRHQVRQNRYLAALAVLKIAVGAEKGDRTVLRLLSEAIKIETAEQSVSTDPFPREFFGTTRTHVALSILRRDRMAIVPLPTDGSSFGAHGWVVAQSDQAGDDLTPSGWALVWWNKTEVAGTLRPAGDRQTARRKLELSAKVALLGSVNPRQGATRFRARVTDLSPSGARLQMSNQFDRLHGIDWTDRRLRLEFHSPNHSEPLCGIGRIRWTDECDDSTDILMGLQFVDPTPEFVKGIEEVLAPGHSDVQYLWSLLESEGK